MNKLPLWFYLAATILPYLLAEYLSKLWAIEHKFSVGLGTFICFSVCEICWLGVMSHRNQLFVMGMVWQIIIMLTSALVGLVCFSEKLNTSQWLGVACATFATFLLLKR